jgi:hypothetical protein
MMRETCVVHLCEYAPELGPNIGISLSGYSDLVSWSHVYRYFTMVGPDVREGATPPENWYSEVTYDL